MKTKHVMLIIILIYSIYFIVMYNTISISDTATNRPVKTRGLRSNSRMANFSCTFCGTNVNELCPKGLSSNTEDLFCKMPPQFDKRYRNPCWRESSGNLSCLPYFMIIGMPKCGTTDMMASLLNHPDIEPPIDKDGGILKELHFFDACHYKRECSYFVSFRDYVSHFRRVADVISNGLEHAITGDATPGYLWRLYTWSYLPQNVNSETPKIILPNIIKHLLPDIKLIIILRDPVERAHSSFFFEHSDIADPAKVFELTAYRSINQIRQCFWDKSETECIMDVNFMLGSQVNHFLESLYIYYIRQWMSVFPREQFLTLTFEEYLNNKTEVINKVFSFLNIRTFSTGELNSYQILKSTDRNMGSKTRFIPIKEELRDFLYDFYQQYNELLYNHLTDFTFRWKKEVYSIYKSRLDEEYKRATY